MIKRFSDFISESVDYDELEETTIDNIGEELYSKNKSFFSRFHSFLKDIDDDFWFGSWSDISNYRNKVESDEIWSVIDKFMDSNKITMSEIKEHKDIIFENIDTYSSISAIVDIVLYQLDNNYEVGGGGTSDDPDEAFIKYSYGYHKTTYGRIFLKRYWGSVGNFLSSVYDNLVNKFVIDVLNAENCLDEIKEDGGLMINNNGLIRIYLEGLFYIVGAYLDVKDYNSFKKLYKNWLVDTMKIEEDEISDEDQYIDLDFSDEY